MNYDRIKKVLSHWIPSYKIRQPSSGNMYVPCPLAKWTHTPKPGMRYGSDSSGSLSIKVGPGRSKWKCWACHKAGRDLDSLIKARAYHEGVNYDHLISEVKNIDFADMGMDDDFFAEYSEEYVPKVTKEYIEKFIKLAEWARFEPATVVKFNIHYDPTRKRVVLPVYAADGSIVGAQGRATEKAQQPRYYNYENFQKGRCLFGLQVGEGSTIVLVEGPTDAMKVHEATGLPVAAMMGSDLTATQAKILRSYDTVILALDYDKAGTKGTNKATGHLISDVHLKVVNWPPLLTMYKQWLKGQLDGESEEGVVTSLDPGKLPKHLLVYMIENALNLA